MGKIPRKRRHIFDTAVIKQVVVFEPEDLRPNGVALPKVPPVTLKQFLRVLEEAYVTYAVKVSNKDYKKAAKTLGIPERGFHSFLKRRKLTHVLTDEEKPPRPDIQKTSGTKNSSTPTL